MFSKLNLSIRNKQPAAVWMMTAVGVNNRQIVLVPEASSFQTFLMILNQLEKGQKSAFKKLHRTHLTVMKN